MQNLEWYLADLKSTGKNTMKTVEKSLTDMFIILVRIYPRLQDPTYHDVMLWLDALVLELLGILMSSGSM